MDGPLTLRRLPPRSMIPPMLVTRIGGCRCHPLHGGSRSVVWTRHRTTPENEDPTAPADGSEDPTVAQAGEDPTAALERPRNRPRRSAGAAAARAARGADADAARGASPRPCHAGGGASHFEEAARRRRHPDRVHDAARDHRDAVGLGQPAAVQPGPVAGAEHPAAPERRDSQHDRQLHRPGDLRERQRRWADRKGTPDAAQAARRPGRRAHFRMGP